MPIIERNDNDCDNDDAYYDEAEQLDDLLLHHDEKPQLTRNIEENLKDRSAGGK